MEKFCVDCGILDYPVNKNKGSIGIEAALLFFSVLGGALNLIFGAAIFLVFIIYCIWRLSSKHQVCPSCENQNIIPVDSPVAQNLISQIYKSNR